MNLASWVMVMFGFTYVISQLVWWVAWPLGWVRPPRRRGPVRLTWADDQ